MRKFIALGAFLSVFAASIGIYSMAWSMTSLSAPLLNLELTSPDVLIRTKSLSKLPADLLRVPLLRDLLSEDFLFYYESGEERLGLSGTIRRIAYEREPTWSDDIIKSVLNESAEVALWRGQRGDLQYYTIAMTRNQLAKLLEPVAKIAMKDRQLKWVGETSIDGEKIGIFALNYTWNKTLLFASLGDRVVVFSNPGMLLNEKGTVDPSTSGLLSALLSRNPTKQHPFDPAFQLNQTDSDHSIAVKTDFLAFSYQTFFPTLKALRFDFNEKPGKDGQLWSTAMLIDAAPNSGVSASGAQQLWSALPNKPGLCAALPADWKRVASAMSQTAHAKPLAEKIVSRLDGPGAVCWYAQSRLHTPLFSVRLADTTDADAALSALFDYAMNGEEHNEDPEEEDAETVAKKDITAKDVSTKEYPAPTSNEAGDKIWQVGDERNGGWRPMLARSGNYVYFSPDAALVEQALAVSHKKQPALSDGWSNTDSDATLAVILPKQLAQLAKQEVTISLPRSKNEVLRDAAERHLFPRLAAVEKYAPIRMQVRAENPIAGWRALDWRQN